MTAAAGGAGAAAIRIASAFIGVAPALDEEEFQKSGESASDYFAEGFAAGVKKQASEGVLRDVFFDKNMQFARWGERYAEDFFNGFDSVLSRAANSWSVADVFGFSEKMFEPIQAAFQKLYDSTVGAIPLVGDAVTQLGSLLGSAYGPIKEYTLALQELGDHWTEVRRRLAGQTTDMEDVDRLAKSIQNVYENARGVLVNEQDIWKNLGEVASRMGGMTQHEIENFTVMLSQANDILGDVKINVHNVTGAMNAFGIEGSKATQQLERWVNIMRDTGAGEKFNTILGQTLNIGPSMRQLGYDVDSVVRIFARMNEEGEPMGRLVWSFSGAVKRLADEVQNNNLTSVRDGWVNLIQSTQNYIKAGTRESLDAAQSMLTEWVGQRGAPVMMEAIAKGILKVPEAAKAEIKDMGELLNASIADANNATATTGEVLEQLALQIKSSFAPLGGVLVEGLKEYGMEFSQWLTDHRSEVVEWAGDLSSAMLRGLEGFISFSGHMLKAFAPAVEVLKDLVSGFFDFMLFRMELLSKPFAAVDKALGGKLGIDDFNKALGEARAGLDTLQKFDLGKLGQGVGDGLIHFSDDVLPKIREQISGFVDLTVRELNVRDALSLPTGKDGAPEVQVNTDKEGLFLKGTAEQLTKVQEQLAKLGFDVDINKQTGEIERILTSNKELADSFAKVWDSYAKKSPGVEGKELTKQLNDILRGAGVEVPVSPIPSDNLSPDAVAESLFPSNAAPSAWVMEPDGTFTVPANFSVEDSDSKTPQEILTSMGVPSQLQSGDGIAIPVSYNMMGGGFSLAGFGMGGGAWGQAATRLNDNEGGGVASQPSVVAAANAVLAQFGSQIRGSIGGSRAYNSAPGTHEVGLAMDIPIGPDQMALGDQINAWLQQNAAGLNIKYTIWKDQGLYADGDAIPDFNAPGHFDHIDVQFKDGTPGPLAGMMGMMGMPGMPATAGGLPPFVLTSSSSPLSSDESKKIIAQKIINAALARGYSMEEATHILAYAIGESSLDPTRSGGMQGDDEVIGLFQQKTAFSGGLTREQRMNPDLNIAAYLNQLEKNRHLPIDQALPKTSVGGPLAKGPGARPQDWNNLLAQARALVGPVTGPGTGMLFGDDFVSRLAQAQMQHDARGLMPNVDMLQAKLLAAGAKIPYTSTDQIAAPSPDELARQQAAIAYANSAPGKLLDAASDVLSPAFWINEVAGIDTNNDTMNEKRYFVGLSEITQVITSLYNNIMTGAEMKQDDLHNISFNDLLSPLIPKTEFFLQSGEQIFNSDLSGKQAGAVAAMAAIAATGAGNPLRGAVSEVKQNALKEAAAKAIEQASRPGADVSEASSIIADLIKDGATADDIAPFADVLEEAFARQERAQNAIAQAEADLKSGAAQIPEGGWTGGAITAYQGGPQIGTDAMRIAYDRAMNEWKRYTLGGGTLADGSKNYGAKGGNNQFKPGAEAIANRLLQDAKDIEDLARAHAANAGIDLLSPLNVADTVLKAAREQFDAVYGKGSLEDQSAALTVLREAQDAYERANGFIGTPVRRKGEPEPISPEAMAVRQVEARKQFAGDAEGLKRELERLEKDFRVDPNARIPHPRTLMDILGEESANELSGDALREANIAAANDARDRAYASVDEWKKKAGEELGIDTSKMGSRQIAEALAAKRNVVSEGTAAAAARGAAPADVSSIYASNAAAADKAIAGGLDPASILEDITNADVRAAKLEDLRWLIQNTIKSKADNPYTADLEKMMYRMHILGGKLKDLGVEGAGLAMTPRKAGKSGMVPDGNVLNPLLDELNVLQDDYWALKQIPDARWPDREPEFVNEGKSYFDLGDNQVVSHELQQLINWISDAARKGKTFAGAQKWLDKQIADKTSGALPTYEGEIDQIKRAKERIDEFAGRLAPDKWEWVPTSTPWTDPSWLTDELRRRKSDKADSGIPDMSESDNFNPDLGDEDIPEPDEPYAPSREEELRALGFEGNTLRQLVTDMWQSRVADEIGRVQETLRGSNSPGGGWFNRRNWDEYTKSKYGKNRYAGLPESIFTMPEEDFNRYASDEVLEAFRNGGRPMLDDMLRSEGLKVRADRQPRQKRRTLPTLSKAARDALRAAQEAGGGKVDTGMPRVEDVVPAPEVVSPPKDRATLIDAVRNAATADDLDDALLEAFPDLSLQESSAVNLANEMAKIGQQDVAARILGSIGSKLYSGKSTTELLDYWSGLGLLRRDEWAPNTPFPKINPYAAGNAMDAIEAEFGSTWAENDAIQAAAESDMAALKEALATADAEKAARLKEAARVAKNAKARERRAAGRPGKDLVPYTGIPDPEDVAPDTLTGGDFDGVYGGAAGGWYSPSLDASSVGSDLEPLLIADFSAGEGWDFYYGRMMGDNLPARKDVIDSFGWESFPQNTLPESPFADEVAFPDVGGRTYYDPYRREWTYFPGEGPLTPELIADWQKRMGRYGPADGSGELVYGPDGGDPLSYLPDLARSGIFTPGMRNERGRSYFNDAVGSILFNQYGSTAMLQRKLKLSHEKSSKLMELLERRGIIGPDPGDGTARKVNFEANQLSEVLNRLESDFSLDMDLDAIFNDPATGGFYYPDRPFEAQSPMDANATAVIGPKSWRDMTPEEFAADYLRNMYGDQAAEDYLARKAAEAAATGGNAGRVWTDTGNGVGHVWFDPRAERAAAGGGGGGGGEPPQGPPPGGPPPEPPFEPNDFYDANGRRIVDGQMDGSRIIPRDALEDWARQQLSGWGKKATVAGALTAFMAGFAALTDVPEAPPQEDEGPKYPGTPGAPPIDLGDPKNWPQQKDKNGNPLPGQVGTPPPPAGAGAGAGVGPVVPKPEDAAGAAGTPSGATGAMPDAPHAGVGTIPGAPPGLAPDPRNGDLPKPIGTPYGDMTQYDPYVNKPPWPMTPEEFQNWKNDYDKAIQRRKEQAQKLGEWDGKIADLAEKEAEAREDAIKKRKIVTKMEELAAAADQAAGNTAASDGLKARKEYRDAKKAAEDAEKRAENAEEATAKAKRDKDNAFEDARIAAEDPLPQPKKKKGQWDTDKNAEALGHGLVKGVLEEFGFDGSLFQNPLEWGITKLLTGGVNFGLGLMQAGQEGAGGTATVGQSAAGGAAAQAGIPNIAKMFEPQLPGASMPSDPASVTAATAKSDTPDQLMPGLITNNIDASVIQTNNGLQDVNAAAMPLAAAQAEQGRWAPSMAGVPVG